MEEKIEKNKEKNQKQAENFFIGLFKWKMDEEELKNQVENYATLGFFRSVRKVATALMIFSAIITLIFVMVGWSPSETWVDAVLILILSFFVYKGQKWAMISTMIYWTFSKGLQIVNGFSAENFSGGNIIMPIIWWAIFMGAFWQAYQVEGKRKKQSKISLEYPRFCRNCGSQLDENSKYCAKCGAKITLVE